MRIYALLMVAAAAVMAPAMAGSSTYALGTAQSGVDNTTSTSGSTATTTSGSSSTSSLPTVELDYTTVQAVGGNTTVGYYKYQNIRYAKVPTGDLRFAAPEWPEVETETNTGTNLADADVDCSRRKTACLFDLSTDFVFVAYNYHLGITGLATGPTYQHEGGDANLCVWDSTHAFEWVQKYISNFGGNPDDVTAMGFSAGGSQVLFQMTRFGGNAPQLFHKAYVMSPGYVPGAGHHHGEQFWQNVSSAVGCDGGHLDCMRQVDFSNLTSASDDIVSEYTYQMQPRVDGFIIPDTYEANLYQGHFNFSGPCVISHEQHEANSQAYDGVDSQEDVSTYLRIFFPAITDDVIEELLELYPEDDYDSAGLRFADMKQSFDLTGKNLALTHALNNQTWNAEVALSSATHGTDQSYYWYSTYSLSTSSSSSSETTTTTTTMASSGASTTSVGDASSTGMTDGSSTGGPGGAGGMGGMGGSSVNATIAVMMQKYLLSFVLTGNPNTMWADDKIYWPQYNESSSGIQMIFNDTFTTGDDDLANSKSLFWNKALWY
ncbi:unnamed protein product [Phytophthora lilii]|uniref:Unnamed protein product n=1 Tax=Phytophthora lilii TaxID=2077276 RepID=A0A9W6WYS9_9STRA|nr:unnamed protein product [Phytophthora lilii]